MNTTKACIRGCGIRSAGGVYLCLGIGMGGTLHVEELILDPIRPWPEKWQRGFKLLRNKQGWYDVAIFVGESFYKSLWDFVEETRRFGISRKVPPTFPFEKLTPGKSQMVFLHRKAVPLFDGWDAQLDYKIAPPLPHCHLKWEPEIWRKANPGWHPKVERETLCTFAHQHFAGLIHDAYYDDQAKFEINLPSFSYSGHYPVVKSNDDGSQPELKWGIGAFMVAPISHIEMPHKLNKPAAQKANKSGYEVIQTEW